MLKTAPVLAEKNIDALQRIIEQLRTENLELAQTNQNLLQEIAWLKRQIFGTKSERFIPANPQQTTLELGVTSQSIEPVETVTVPEHKRNVTKNADHPGRDQIPAHIPRVVIEVKPDFDTTGMEQIGKKITERLEYKPAQFFVNQYVCPVYRKTVQGYSTLVNTPAPVLFMDKGKLGASVVAHVMLSKCEDHLPIYRIAKMLSRDANYPIAEATLRGAFHQGAFLIEAIVNRMRTIVHESTYLQMDESTIRVVIQPSQGKSHQGYMIVSHAPPEKILLFDYRHTRNVRYIKELVGPFKGTLQTDGLELYPAVCLEKNLVHAGCMDHCRRTFEKALDENQEKAGQALEQMKILYSIERQAKDAQMDASERLALREEKSKPVFERLVAWAKDLGLSATPKSYLGKALGYLLTRVEELSVFLRDGRVEISSAKIENGIRPLAVGRKNYLMCGSEAAAHRLGVVYSVVGTCKLHGINTRDYLADVLDKLPGRNANNIDDLLPWNWAKKIDPS